MMGMDVYSFVNSRDVERYLRGINYSFSTLEVAWLIWQSRRNITADKHELWEMMMLEYEDCEMSREESSLFSYLDRRIKEECGAAHRFYTTEPNSYYTGYVMTVDRSSCYDAGSYTTLDECIRGLDGLAKTDVLYYEISKYVLEGEEYREQIIARLDDECNIASLSILGKEDLLASVTVKLPVPFCRGDILCRTGVGIAPIFACDYQEKLVYLYYADDEWSERSGGYDGMRVTGYFWRYDRLEHGSEGCYLDFEISDGCVYPDDELLILTSGFLKKKMNAVDFAERYHLAKLKGEISSREKYLNKRKT